MENNSKKIKSKKLEIKTIIDDLRKFIEVCGSNYSEKNSKYFKKKILQSKKISFVMKEMIILKI